MIQHYKDAFVQTDNEAITRKILAHHGGLMLLEIRFNKASDDYGLHSHPHEQIAYVLKGRFEFMVDGQVSDILGEGDSIYFPPNSIHGGKALEDNCILLDIFTPQRDDFLPPQS